jgi:starch synthase
MRILFIASEAFTLGRVRSLADVISSLAPALRHLSHDPCLILLKYSSIKARGQEIQNNDIYVPYASAFWRCGLGQLIPMRYGTTPVVRHTSGLADTVKDAAETDGNGFVFANYMVSDMPEAIERAEASFYRRAEWHNLIRRNMKLDLT